MIKKLFLLSVLAATFTVNAADNAAPVDPHTPPVEAAKPADVNTQAPVQNQSANQPLMIIRLNKAVVDYQAQLQTLIKQTLEVKANATFELVGFFTNASSEASLNDELNNVKNIIVASGLAADKIKISKMPAQNIPYNEIHILLQQ